MRVLHVHRITGVGGSERHLLVLLPALRAAGVDASLLVLDGGGAEPFYDAAARAGVVTRSIPSRGAADPALLPRLGRVLREMRPDVVHTHLMHADVYGQAVARGLRLPTVSSVHSTFYGYHREPSRSAARAAGRMAGRTIAISEHVARVLRDGRIVPPGRLRVVRYGLHRSLGDISHARRMAAQAHLPAGAVTAVVASRLVPDKGHDVLLRAFAQARSQVPELALLVAGDGPLRSELERLARTLGVHDAVRFLGFVPDALALLAAADVVVFPTQPGFGEGFGLVNLEAMIVGRPVIGTSTASIPEIVVDRETGLLVPPGDVPAMAAALIELAADPALRAAFGAAGRARAGRDFTVERMTSQTTAVYDEVLSAR